MKWRSKYEYSKEFGNARHTWSVVGARGGMHLHITDLGERYEKKHGDRYSGGIEVHYRQPPIYMEDDPPSHDECWLLRSPCWHDGSSMQATEEWIPRWRDSPNDHDRMFAFLEAHANAIFEQDVNH